MAKKSVRNMKVCGQSGYQYKTIPSIMLKGQWLKDWGFEIDDAIVVKCEDGCFLQALFPQKCRLNSSKLHGEFPHYCISSAGTLSGAGEEPLQAYKVY